MLKKYGANTASSFGSLRGSGGFYLPDDAKKSELLILASKYRTHLAQMCFALVGFLLVILFIALFVHKIAFLSFSFIILNSFFLGALGVKLWSTKQNYVLIAT